MAKATVRIFKNHGFKQINRNIEELKFTLLNYNTVYGHEIEMYTVEQGEKRDKRQ